MRTSWQRIQLGACLLAAVFVAAVLGYRFVGDYDWISAVWMVVITISTVGYSENSNLPPHLQLMTIAVILLGMTASVYTFGGVFRFVLEGEIENALGRRRMSKEILSLSGHTIICGYGRMGHNLAQELESQNQQMVVIDQDPDVVAEATADGFLCLLGDATEEEALADAGIDRAGTLVSTFPNDAESVFITLTARNMNSAIKIVARAERESTQRKLRQAGADTIVMPTVVGARHMGRIITRPSTARLINFVEEDSNREVDLDEILVRPGGRLAGMTVQATNAHRNHRLLVVAIKSHDGELRFTPDAEEVLHEGDTLLIIGHRDQIARFRSQCD